MGRSSYCFRCEGFRPTGQFPERLRCFRSVSADPRENRRRAEEVQRIQRILLRPRQTAQTFFLSDPSDTTTAQKLLQFSPGALAVCAANKIVAAASRVDDLVT